MREMFNSLDLWTRAKAKEFQMVVMESRQAPPSSGEPDGTLSQMVSYRDGDSNEIARVHQYLRADGTIGASGLPDPKRLFHDGTLYRLERKKKMPSSTQTVATQEGT